MTATAHSTSIGIGRASLLTMVLVGCSFGGDVEWRRFALGTDPGVTMRLGRTIVTVRSRRPAAAGAFPGDFLELIIHQPNGRQGTLAFRSSYGKGALAAVDDLVLLRYGIGRGTNVRTEHVKILQLTDHLREVADIQMSYWQASDKPSRAAPTKRTYRCAVQHNENGTTFRFYMRQPVSGLPTEKPITTKPDKPGPSK